MGARPVPAAVGRLPRTFGNLTPARVVTVLDERCPVNPSPTSTSDLPVRIAVAFVATVVLAVVVGVGPLATPAAAHNWSGATNGIGCQQNITDTANQSYHYSSVPSQKLRDAVTFNRTNNVDPLVLTTTSYSSYDAFTDVVVFQGDWSGNSSCRVMGTDGLEYWRPWCCEQVWTDSNGNALPTLAAVAWCESRNPATECEQHRLYFDTDAFALNSWQQAYMRGMVCHEIGHTLGLHHGDACMQDPPSGSQTGFWQDQRNHINAYTGF